VEAGFDSFFAFGLSTPLPLRDVIEMRFLPRIICYDVPIPIVQRRRISGSAYSAAIEGKLDANMHAAALNLWYLNARVCTVSATRRFSSWPSWPRSTDRSPPVHSRHRPSKAGNRGRRQHAQHAPFVSVRNWPFAALCFLVPIKSKNQTTYAAPASPEATGHVGHVASAG